MTVFAMFRVFILAIVFRQTTAQGRAFPIQAENDAIELLTGMNGKLQYDRTNFLVDLSGQYATCDSIGTYGLVEVQSVTPDGETIKAIVDATYGRNNDVNSVVGYIDEVIQRWSSNPSYLPQIRHANRFGCSVRPGCDSYVAVVCLFSPGYDPAHPTVGPTSFHAPKVVAFTPEQYSLAEEITNSNWGRDHFLENLSGSETNCDMIGAERWRFKAPEIAKIRQGIVLHGVYGYYPNLYSTENALRAILDGFQEYEMGHVGCSLIADCMLRDQMYVVASCLYEQ